MIVAVVSGDIEYHSPDETQHICAVFGKGQGQLRKLQIVGGRNPKTGMNQVCKSVHMQAVVARRAVKPASGKIGLPFEGEESCLRQVDARGGGHGGISVFNGSTVAGILFS